MLLNPEEYIEQAYFFRMLRERMQQSISTQELLLLVKQEVLATTQLPYAIDFLAGELRLTGGFATAMARLPHYFTSFQTYLVSESEKAEGRFDFRTALEIMEKEAEYRAKNPAVQGMFLFQFEVLCRNRLGYDRGLDAIAGDGVYDDGWREWLSILRRQVGLVDFCDMLYVRSELYRRTRGNDEKPVLFGEKEGRIALANRQKDPLYLFAALQRHLGYPAVPRPSEEDTKRYVIPQMQAKIDRLEMRIKLLEEDLHGGINLNRFYGPQGEQKKVE
jgi:hypothetical protein